MSLAFRRVGQPSCDSVAESARASNGADGDSMLLIVTEEQIGVPDLVAAQHSLVVRLCGKIRATYTVSYREDFVNGFFMISKLLHDHGPRDIRDRLTSTFLSELSDACQGKLGSEAFLNDGWICECHRDGPQSSFDSRGLVFSRQDENVQNFGQFGLSLKQARFEGPRCLTLVSL